MVRAALGAAETELAAVDGIDAELDAVAEQVRAVAVELDDAASALRAYLDGIEAEPGRLEQLEERLARAGPAEAKARRLDRGGARRTRSAAAPRSSGWRTLRSSPRSSSGGCAARAERRDGPGAGARRGASEGGQASSSGGSPTSSERWRWRAPRSRCACEPHPDGFGPSGSETVEFRVATNPGIPASPLARRGVRRRALADHARADRPRGRGRALGRWYSTRSTPASAATRPGRWGRGFAGWGPSASSSASRTCPRWPRWPSAHFRIVKKAGRDGAQGDGRAGGRR